MAKKPSCEPFDPSVEVPIPDTIPCLEVFQKIAELAKDKGATEIACLVCLDDYLQIKMRLGLDNLRNPENLIRPIAMPPQIHGTIIPTFLCFFDERLQSPQFPDCIVVGVVDVPSKEALFCVALKAFPADLPLSACGCD